MVHTEDQNVECHKIGYTFNSMAMQKNYGERFKDGNYFVDASRSVKCNMQGWDNCRAMNGILCDDSRWVTTTYVLEEPTSCTLRSHGDDRGSNGFHERGAQS